MQETEIVQPLTADEIKQALITKVCESLWEAMDRTCNLFQTSYPKFKASGEINLSLAMDDDERNNRGETLRFKAEIDIPYTPPNVLRRETGQGIPVAVEQEDGSIEQKSVIYKRPMKRNIGRISGNE